MKIDPEEDLLQSTQVQSQNHTEENSPKWSFKVVDKVKESEEEQAAKKAVVKMFIEGKSVPEIAAASPLPFKKVTSLIEATQKKISVKDVRQEVKEEMLLAKVPILEEIVSLSLNTVKEFLVELSTNEVKKVLLTTKEAKDIMAICKDLNEMLRLELGQSTQNLAVVEMSYDQTKNLLDDLRAKDPVFEYPLIGNNDPSRSESE